MALTVPLSLLDFPGYLTDDDGAPLNGGWMQFYIAGTTTPLDTYADVNGDATNTNPLQVDSSGRYVVFLSNASLYDIVVYEASLVDPDIPGAELYTREGVGNPGAIVYAALGNTLATGSANVVSGYQVLSTDQLVTVASTGGANPCVIQLPPASDRASADNGNGLPLTVKNLGTIAISLTPDGADTIDTLAAVYTIPAGASPLFPSVFIVSDGESAWTILASHGIA